MRSIEEAFPTFNYFKGQNAGSVAQHITNNDRSFAIQKIFELHAIKKYKVETLFTACQVFDRYLITAGYKNFARKDIFTLTIISLLIAAKLEEAIAPSFLKMLSMVSESET
jgi:hypothetical protein